MTPTAIHMVGMLRRKAATPNPMIRMMKPMRYVPNEDICFASGDEVGVKESKEYAQSRVRCAACGATADAAHGATCGVEA
jgi:hypothetical protein